MKKEFLNSIFPDFVEKYDITYRDFLTGRKKLKKEEIKLSKLFRQFSHSEDDNERFLSFLRTKLTSQDSEEIVISYNFADWFLASTKENWGSCLNLESSYESAYWTGLPGLIADKNRVMIYLTTKEKKEYRGIKTDNFISRTWALLGENDFLYWLMFYPSPFKIADNFIDAVKERSKIKGIEPAYSYDIITKYSINPLFFKTGDSCFIYQDRSFFYAKENNIYIKVGDFGGALSIVKKDDKSIIRDGAVFEFSGGLSSLIGNETDITDASSLMTCASCGAPIDYDDYMYDGECYCEGCFNEMFFICESCGETFPDHEANYVNGTYYCNSCYEEFFTECANCSTTIDRDDAFETKDGLVCNDCFEEHYIECNHCNKYEHEKFIITDGENYYCKDCFESLEMKKCKMCGKIIKKDEIGYKNDLCEYCNERYAKNRNLQISKIAV